MHPYAPNEKMARRRSAIALVSGLLLVALAGIVIQQTQTRSTTDTERTTVVAPFELLPVATPSPSAVPTTTPAIVVAAPQPSDTALSWPVEISAAPTLGPPTTTPTPPPTITVLPTPTPNATAAQASGSSAVSTPSATVEPSVEPTPTPTSTGQSVVIVQVAPTATSAPAVDSTPTPSPTVPATDPTPTATVTPDSTATPTPTPTTTPSPTPTETARDECESDESGPVTDLRITGTTESSITIEWSAQAAPMSIFVNGRYHDNIRDFANRYVIEGLDANVDNRIVFTDHGAEPDVGSTVCGVTNDEIGVPPITAPAMATNLVATDVTATGATLTWTAAPSGGRYVLFQGTLVEGQRFPKISSAPGGVAEGDATTFTFTDLVPGSSNVIGLRTIIGNNQSNYAWIEIETLPAAG